MHDLEMPAGGPYGERLLPQIIDAYVQSDPERVYALVPYSIDVAQGFRKITYRNLASAVNGVAWWIDREIGHSDNFETLAYMGASDIRYAIFFFAAIKCGYKVFCTADMAKKIPELEKNVPDLRYFVLASLDELLSASSVHYPLVIDSEIAQGAPKPIILPNGAFSVIDNQRRLSKLEGRRNMDYSLFDLGGKGFINTFPGFHVGGMVAMTALPIFYNSHVVMVPSQKPANGEMMGQIMSQMPIRGVFTPPTVVEELLETPEGLSQIARTEFVMYGGGPLAPAAGDRISQVTCLTSAIGSTEAGIIPARVPTREDWSYFEWHPDYEVDMVHVHTDIYELTIPNPARMAWIHTIWHTFPDVKVWRTNDHYKKHPTKPGLFMFRGRGDDVIVLSNGEKFQPVTTESIVQGHPDIEGALVVGTGRFQPALIIEPRVPIVDAEAFIEQIWPTVQQANQEAAAHGKIFRGKVILASPEKPFIRAGKGSIIRPKSTALYADEVEALFTHATGNMELGGLSTEQVQDFTALRASVGNYVRSIIPDLPKGSTGGKEDFYAWDLDSVQTIELASGLRALLKPHLNLIDLSTIAAKAVYANSTIDSLSGFIGGLMGLTKSDATTERSTRMSAMLERYTDSLPAALNGAETRGVVPSMNDKTSENGISITKSAPHMNGEAQPNGVAYANGVANTNGTSRSSSHGPALCVLLTGSTGSLGTQLLQALIEDPQISKIICLNRAENALQRAQKSLTLQNIRLDLVKVEFHKAQFADPHFGLSAESYSSLLTQINIIIHNAWNVNFNQSLESFSSQILSVRHFIDWSISSPLHPRIQFVSSISSIANWASCYPSDTLIPESSLLSTDYAVALPMGYGESKHIAERLLATAASRCGVSVDILRLGQVAGPIGAAGGSWNRSEWFPGLIQTSKALGCIPDAVMDVDWIPADVLANIICDLVHDNHKGLRTYNLINPHNREWKDLVPAMQKFVGGKVVSLQEWTDMLGEVDGSDTTEMAAKPALKILEWFKSLAAGLSSGQKPLKYVTVNGAESSKTMAELGPVSPEWMMHWLEQLDL
ncbi:hypothetical protein P7C71_g3783, partial [Lecanoromycetidae sp. Uapishka_2]